MHLFLENVRCFSGSFRLDIRPLTLLVGENSTGKSTVLAMLSAVSQAGQFPFGPDFNEKPYELGNYRTIATATSLKNQVEQFSIGCCDDSSEITATYTNKSGLPGLAKLHYETSDGSVEIDLVSNHLSIEFRDGGGTQKKGTFSIQQYENEASVFLAHTLLESPKFTILNKLIILELNAKNSKAWPKEELISAIKEIIGDGSGPGRLQPVRSLAPVRTKPRRTHDVLRADFNPEGDHIPMLLSRILRQAENSQRTALLKTLEAFGVESQLFHKLNIRHFGTQEGDPFEVQVKLARRFTNLIDVGYGVSQALPVIVESVLAEPKHRLLLQQPEVHLHPRAQAALGSFFARLVSASSKKFVIETHSDYLLDRVRQEVANGTLSSGKVGILFFERQGATVKVHQISLDEQGNVIGAPECYRQFFIDEEEKLLTRGS